MSALKERPDFMTLKVRARRRLRLISFEAAADLLEFPPAPAAPIRRLEGRMLSRLQMDALLPEAEAA